MPDLMPDDALPEETPLPAAEPPAGIESPAVVPQTQLQVIAFGVQFDFDAGGSGMARDIVNSLLKDQINLAPHIGSDPQIVVGQRRPKLQ